ncbi:MAG: transcription termination factor NusA [Candidatus Marinimicrobia bacterium]|nr:transcription termination factor NusA [Candidatus Neomarinimicrobiota bacterium]HJM46959.1 transcription termination factor NusA [Candidatus Neomarinimicrobiota bacterium]
MINRELIEIFSELARNNNVDRSELGSIIEQLFLYIIEKQYGDSSNCSVIVNVDKGEIEIYAEKTIVKVIDNPISEITLDNVHKLEPDIADLNIGDLFVEVIDPKIFGRRMITHAKNFFSQRLKDVERQGIYEDYEKRVGEIVIGTVHQNLRDAIFVNIERAELKLPKSEQIPSEYFRRGDTIRSVIQSVEIKTKGPEIIISRSDNHFLYKLFEMEVPEIEEGLVEIRAVARYPGQRAKIIVYSNDKRVDAVGACVGMRGSRIQAVVRELNNEKVDIIPFSQRSEILISRALAPAKPIDLYIDDDRKYCVAIFNDDDLDAAIGKGGININLASRIVDFRIDAFGKTEYEKQQKEQNTQISDLPGLSLDIVEILERIGLNTISGVLGADEDKITGPDGLSKELLETVYNNIQSFLTEDNSNDSQNEDMESIIESTEE